MELQRELRVTPCAAVVDFHHGVAERCTERGGKVWRNFPATFSTLPLLNSSTTLSRTESHRGDCYFNLDFNPDVVLMQ